MTKYEELTLSAMAPVMNGMMALPTNPIQAMRPMVPVWRSVGITSVMIMTQDGYIGPRATPTREKQRAEPIRDGTNQTMSSRPMAMTVLD